MLNFESIIFKLEYIDSSPIQNNFLSFEFNTAGR